MSIENPIALRSQLKALLDPVVSKRQQDGKYFYVTSSGGLSLYERPLSWFQKIKECLWRCFYNPYPLLKEKILEITGLLDDYLRKERDEVALKEFCSAYTPALNELMRAAKKLKKIGRLVEPMPLPELNSPLDQMVLIRDSYIEEDLVAERSSGHLVPSYHGTMHLLIEGFSQNLTALRIQKRDGETIDKPIISSQHLIVKNNFRDKLSLMTKGAVFFKEISIPEEALDSELHISVDSHWQLTYEFAQSPSSHPYRMQVFFHNTSQMTINVTLSGYPKEGEGRMGESLIHGVAPHVKEAVSVVKKYSPEERIEVEEKLRRARQDQSRPILPAAPSSVLARITVCGAVQRETRLPDYGFKESRYRFTIDHDGITHLKLEKVCRVVERIFTIKADHFGPQSHVTIHWPRGFVEETQAQRREVTLENTSSQAVDIEILLRQPGSSRRVIKVFEMTLGSMKNCTQLFTDLSESSVEMEVVFRKKRPLLFQET